MRKLNNTGIFKAVLLAGSAGIVTLAAPAAAQVSNQTGQGADCEANPQDTRCVGITEQPTPSSPQGTIVVTGSRIARKDYTSNSPTVTVDDRFLKESSTAAVEEQLNKLPQFVVSQSSTVSNTGEGTGGPLAAGGDIQPNATNTPGAATVSLRGVGANRTLVLIDGRRGTPSNASGAVDVSTVPSAALQRVEVISGGASATYGADALAGVTNFILKKDFQGLELDVQAGINQQGGGFEYQISGIMGTDFPDGRGNVSMAMSVNTRELLLQRDLPFYQKLWADPERTAGAFFFPPRPSIAIALTGNQVNPATGVAMTTPGTGCETNRVGAPLGCVLTNYFAGATPGVPNQTTQVSVNEDGSLFIPSSSFGGTNFNARGGQQAFWKPWSSRDAEVGVIWKALSNGTYTAINGLTPATVPTDRYNFLARGNYEITDSIGVFAQGMFSNSTTYTVQEAGGAQGGWDIVIPYGNQPYTGQVTLNGNTYQNPAVPSSIIRNGETFNGVAYVDPTPGVLTDNPNNPAFATRYAALLGCGAAGGVGGCTNTQAFQQRIPDTIEALLKARSNPNAPFSLNGFLPNPRENYGDVTTYTLVAGLEGSIPGTDWTWEAFVNHGISRTISRQTGMYSLQRLRGVFTAPNFGQNFSATSNGLSNGFGAATGTCTTGLRFFEGYQGISDNCRAAIAEDNTNVSTARQTIAEANLQGGLFDLPLSHEQLRFALGASYREERYQFLPAGAASAGRAYLDSIVGIYPGTLIENTGYNVKELYGELLIPLLKDIPFIQELNLEVGGRMSDYSTTGTSYTYKILGDWQITDWLRLRGGYNRAERAPNIAEESLELQQQFAVDAIGDVCSTRHNLTISANPNTNPSGALDTQAVCLALMERDNNGVYAPIFNADGSENANSYYAPSQATTRQATGGGGFSFAPRVGNAVFRKLYNPNGPVLKPEKADTYTIGAVIRSPLTSGLLSRLNLTVDYFNITINDPIGPTPAGGQLARCVSGFYNPAVNGVAAGATNAAGLNNEAIKARARAAIADPTSTCNTGVARNPSTGSGFNGQFNDQRVVGTYSNEGQIKLDGIDANLSWSANVGPGQLFVNLNGNYMFHFKLQAFAGQPLIDYVGTTGTGAIGVSSGSSFRYRLFGVLGYSWGPLSASLQWQHIPATEDGNEALFLNGLAPAGTDQNGLPTYDLFNLNTSFQVNDAVRLRLGVDNLFNRRPPISNIDVNIDRSLGQLPGGSYSGFHDTLGRRFSFGANVRF